LIVHQLFSKPLVALARNVYCLGQIDGLGPVTFAIPADGTEGAGPGLSAEEISVLCVTCRDMLTQPAAPQRRSIEATEQCSPPWV